MHGTNCTYVAAGYVIICDSFGGKRAQKAKGEDPFFVSSLLQVHENMKYLPLSTKTQ